MNKILYLITLTGVVFGSMFSHANIQLADEAYEKQQFERAFEEYLLAAKIGNPRAQHTLGMMYVKGQGIEQDNLKALGWFALAASQSFDNSKKVAASVYKNMDVQEKRLASESIAENLGLYGQEALKSTIYPYVIEKNRGKKVLFEGGKLSTELIEELDIDFGFESSDDYGDDENFGDVLDFGTNTGASILPVNAYFLVVDTSISKYGKTRDIDVQLSYGFSGNAMRKVRRMKVPAATFEGEAIEFDTRLMLGQAQNPMRLITLSDKYPRLSRAILKNRSHAKKGDPFAIYQYAVTLEYFQGVKRQPGEVVDLLTQAATAGIIEAQFVLGRKLYRDQIDPEKGVYWLAEAAKQGLANAEYQLGRIFLHSPWFHKDERAAAFWLNRSAKQGYLFGLREAAMLNIFAHDTDLKNPQLALERLERIRIVDSENPETFQLLAWAYRKNKQKPVAIKTMEKAIFMGKQQGWDTAIWEETLESWQSRGVVRMEEIAP